MKHVARKRFGQHFLTDRGIIEDIIQAINPKAGEPMDRVDRALLVQGDTVVAEPSTYRGDGLALV